MNRESQTIRKKENRSSPIYTGGLALGLAIGIPLGIIFVLGWEFFLDTLAVNGPTELIGIFAALAAVTSSALAFLALNEQRKSRQAGTDPVLIAHFTHRHDAKEMVMLTISNVGSGAAMNVSIIATADFEPTDFPILTNVFERLRPFRTIIHGDQVSFNFGIGFDLLAETPVPPFKVSLLYSDIDGSEYSGEFELDIREMERLGAEQTLAARQAKATEAISKDISKSHKRLEQLIVEVTNMKNSFRQVAKLPSPQDKKET